MKRVIYFTVNFDWYICLSLKRYVEQVEFSFRTNVRKTEHSSLRLYRFHTETKRFRTLLSSPAQGLLVQLQ